MSNEEGEMEKTRKMRDMTLIIGVLNACKEQIETVELFIEELPPELVEDLKAANTLVKKARDSAVREFARLQK